MSLTLTLALLPALPAFTALVVQYNRTSITDLFFPSLGQSGEYFWVCTFLGCRYDLALRALTSEGLFERYDIQCNYLRTSCPAFGTAANIVSENCLSANIFRPIGVNASSELPVQVYAYGSGLLSM